MTIQPWQLQENKASLVAQEITGTIRTDHPGKGLQSLACGETVIARQLFGTLSPSGQHWEPNEQYVRQPDVVCHYGIDPADHISRSLYWRTSQPAIAHRTVTQIEQILSLQTDRLDTYPKVELQTLLPPGLEIMTCHLGQPESTWSAALTGDVDFGPNEPLLFLVRQPEQGVSLALTVISSDWGGGRVVATSDDEESMIKLDLVDTSLEKGVIRRYRAAAAMIEGPDELAAAVEWGNAYERSAPPLTT